MKRTKCLLSLILALCLSFALAAPAWATDTDFANDSQKAAIIDVLQYVESDKESFNLSNVNFEDIEIGSAINAYEYTEDGFQEIIKFYPLYYNSEIVALSTTTDDEHYQIETALANKIAQSGIENVAILYDAENCYLYDGSDFISAFDGLTPFTERSLIFNSKNIADTTDVFLTTLLPTEELDYYKPLGARAVNTYRCNVSYVTQKPYNKLCWAADIAMIVNCVKNKNETAVSVAKTCLGGLQDIGVSCSTQAEYLRTKYELNYTFKKAKLPNFIIPSGNAIVENIQEGYPISASFNWYINGKETGHSVTIYATNPIAGYITLMDPLSGSYTAYYDKHKDPRYPEEDWYVSTYSYVPSYRATPSYWFQAICFYW